MGRAATSAVVRAFFLVIWPTCFYRTFLRGVAMMLDERVVMVRDLVVKYDNRTILDGINLDIMRGEVLVLLGGSGSGKSTLLRHVIGLEKTIFWEHRHQRCRYYPLLRSGAQSSPPVHWSVVPERCAIRFHDRFGECRLSPFGAHKARRLHHR